MLKLRKLSTIKEMSTRIRSDPVAYTGSNIENGAPEDFYLPPNNKGVFDTVIETLSYDTVRFSIPGKPRFSHDMLIPLKKFKNHRTHAETSISTLLNLKISESQNGLSIQGSLPTFHHGENLTPLTLQEVNIVMEKISDLLKVNLKESKVYRIDIAANLKMDRPIGDYLHILSSAPRCKRDPYSNETVYFRNTCKCLSFYDKVAEMERHYKLEKNHLPSNLPDPKMVHVLRYEYQTKGNNKIFESPIDASFLTDRDFFIKMSKLWKSNYDSILKSKFTLSRISECSSIPDLSDGLIIAGVDRFGGLDQLMRHFENGIISGKLNRDQKTRFKRKLKEIMKNQNDFHTTGLIEELNNKVENAYTKTFEQVMG